MTDTPKKFDGDKMADAFANLAETLRKAGEAKNAQPESEEAKSEEAQPEEARPEAAQETPAKEQPKNEASENLKKTLSKFNVFKK